MARLPCSLASKMQLLLDALLCALARDNGTHAFANTEWEKKTKDNRNLNAKQIVDDKHLEEPGLRSGTSGARPAQWDLVIPLKHWLGSMHLAGDTLRVPRVVASSTRCRRHIRLFRSHAYSVHVGIISGAATCSQLLQSPQAGGAVVSEASATETPWLSPRPSAPTFLSTFGRCRRFAPGCKRQSGYLDVVGFSSRSVDEAHI